MTWHGDGHGAGFDANMACRDVGTVTACLGILPTHVQCALMWDFIVIACVYYVVFVILLWDKGGDKSYNPCPLKTTGRHTHLDVV